MFYPATAFTTLQRCKTFHNSVVAGEMCQASSDCCLATVSLFTFFAITYMVVIGYWEESMNTLALVIISVPMAIIIGFGLGIWGFYSKRAEKIIMPILDIFQTVPTFAYLLPIY